MSDQSASRVPAWLQPLLWPVIALTALLLFNLLFTEGFAHIEIKNGHFYGSLVDVLKQASRVMLVSLGMTLIIATGGVDLSVGAVIAIAGSVAAQLLVQAHAGLATAILATLGVCLVLGVWNGALVVWRATDCGDARSHGRGPRRGAIAH